MLERGSMLPAVWSTFTTTWRSKKKIRQRKRRDQKKTATFLRNEKKEKKRAESDQVQEG